MVVIVICNRFELLTSCLSSKRSKPTELTDHLLLSILFRKAVAKVRLFFELTKYFLEKHCNTLILKISIFSITHHNHQ